MPSNQRLRLHFAGIVQGVGFRPAIWRLATGLRLSGFVCNRPDGVVVEIEGPEKALAGFREQLDKALPAAARIRQRRTEILPATGERGFAILESRPAADFDFPVGPDLALCPACRAEMDDPADRRYRYPFINCTECGPRLTIVRRLPYDRRNTAMADFPMCAACRREYEDPASRRFHAEAIACPECGPQIFFTDTDGRLTARGEAALELAISSLKEGKIIALKGLGGFHLAAMATAHRAVTRLREKKQRREKPFALMVRDLATAMRLTAITPKEAALLESPSHPIVLLPARPESRQRLSPAVAPGFTELGIMLPYTPLHRLILEAAPGILVMTSGNLSDEPIATDNHEALERLGEIADGFLLHDREIIVRLDDSVTAVVADRPRMLRRSRGQVPIDLELSASRPPVLGLGGELKNCACLVNRDRALFGPHTGDLGTPGARAFFHENLELLQKLAGCEPEIIACDRHPDYYTTLAAGRLVGKTVIPVQHHHAHIVSCLAENRAETAGPVLGLAMDGTGYGDDGKIWGGEFLRVEADSFIRLGQLDYFPLPGGEAAIHEPWRGGLALLQKAFPGSWQNLCRQLDLVPESWNDKRLSLLLDQNLNRPLTSSLGRCFDAVAALLGVCRKTAFEGQAAMLLEAQASQGKTKINLPGLTPRVEKRTAGNYYRLDPLPLIRTLVERRLAGETAANLALGWHQALVTSLMRTALEICREQRLCAIALSGGCFQNRMLLSGCQRWLEENPEARDIKLYTHAKVPTNDGGLALGQAVAAAAKWSIDHV